MHRGYSLLVCTEVCSPLLELTWLFWRVETDDVSEAKKSIHQAFGVFQGDSKLRQHPQVRVGWFHSLLGQDGREFQRLPLGLCRCHSFGPWSKELMAVWSILSVHSNYTFRNWEDLWTQGIRYGQSLGQDSGSHQPLSPTGDHDDPSDSYVSMSSQTLIASC